MVVERFWEFPSCSSFRPATLLHKTHTRTYTKQTLDRHTHLDRHRQDEETLDSLSLSFVEGRGASIIMKQAGNGRAAVSGSSTEPITIEDNTVQHVKDVSGGRRGTYADGQVVPGQHETAAPAAARPAAVAEAVPSSFETPEDR